MRKVVLATAVALALTQPAAQAQQPPKQELSPARACRALERTDRAAFEQMFGTRSNAFGRCVAAIARTRAQAPPDQPGARAETNPGRTCRALQRLDRQAFERMFGTGPNALGKCVSAVAKTRGGEGSP